MSWLVKYLFFFNSLLLQLAASSVIVTLSTTDLYQGSVYNVTWSWDGRGGSNELDYQVLLVKADNDGTSTSLVYASGNPGYYTWTVPTNLDSAYQYYFGIWLTDEVYGSSANFSIHQRSAVAQPSTEIGDPVTASATPSTTSALASPTTAAPTTTSTRSASSTLPFQSPSSADTTLGASTPSAISIPSATSAALIPSRVSRIANPLIVGTTVGAVSILMLSIIGLVSNLRFRRKQKKQQSWRASGSTFGSWRHSFKSVLRPHHRASATTTVAYPETARSSNTLVPFSAEQYSNNLRDLADPRLIIHELPTEAEKTYCLDTQPSDLLIARPGEEASDATSDAWEVGPARVVQVAKKP